MATSGTIKTGTTNDSHFWVKWSQLSQDITNNRTKIKWSCGVYCGHNFYSNAVKMSAVKINGTKVYSGGTYSNKDKGNHTLESGTMYINHNSDGTKSFTISSFNGWVYAGTTKTASAKSYTLNTIPRKANVSAGTDFTDETNPKITFSNPAGFNVMPFLDFYDNLGALVTGLSRVKGKYSSPYTFEITDEERETLRNILTDQQSFKVREGVITYNGTTNMGSSYVTKTMSIVNATPILTSVDAYDINSECTALTGDNHTLIQGISKIAIDWSSAIAKKGAVISSYKVEFQGQTKTYANDVLKPVEDFNVLSSGTSVLKITATDSRGLSVTTQKDVVITPYSLPNGIVTYERVNNYEDETHLKIDGSFSSIIVNGVEKNGMAIQWRWRKNLEGQGWSDWITIEDKVEYTYSFPKESEYIFDCKVTDNFGGVWNRQYTLSKGKFPLFIDTSMNAIGINEFPKTGEALRVAGGTAIFSEGGTLGNQLVSDVLAFALTCPIGITPIYTDETTANIPNAKYRDSVGYVHRRNTSQLTVFLYAYNSNEIAMNTYLSGLTSESDWTGWSILADYIVERGVSGNWIYEKWNSGTIKMWYKGTYSSAFANGNYFGAYRGTSQTINFPLTLKSVTYCDVKHISPNTGFCLVGTLTNSSVIFYPYNRTNQTTVQREMALMVEVVGKWN